MEENIREIIQRELPALVMKDPQIRDWVWHLIHEYAPSRAESESRFEQMLAEIRAMREESERKWEENQRKWEENQRRWEENQRRLEAMREEFQREMRAMREESERKWEENQRKWEENQRKWEESQLRWQENQRLIWELLERIDRVDRRIDRTIGALGARWGVSTEASFRNALRAILEESFGVKVEWVEYRDESGEVFGRPDQVELDVIIRNGQVLVCEIKSAASRSEIYTFERKVRSYEKRTGRKVDRMLLISPMILEKDKELARELGIEVYSDAEEVVS
ncbi:MAG: DUF3782 domain-containing protein [Anaerolineales bacterium]|nr:DUF3782 domain-containing protein [Anaerolineales bacterium]MDW8162155.1 DUF3782 domain-containing protein [Anaerolineales bacterium]